MTKIIWILTIPFVYNVAFGANGSTIKVAWEAPIRFYDSRYAVDADSQYVEDLVHCSLISFNEAGRGVPDLADGEPRWESPTSLVVKIKPNAKFSNGDAVTVEDVKATYNFFLSNSGEPSPRASAFTNIKEITTPNKDEIHFSLKQPDASFVSNLIVGILPKKLAEGKIITEAKNVVGCGPFTLEKTEVLSLSLVPNPNYTLDKTPKVAGIEFKIIRDEKTRFAKLVKGEVDLVQNNINRETLKQISKKYPNLIVQKKLGLKTTYLGFNMKDPLTGNIAVRKAIAYALEKDTIIKYILGDLATPATTMLTPEDPFLSKSLDPYSHDIAKANAVLDAAGLKPAKGAKYRFSLTYKTTTDTTRVNIAKAVASQLKKVGIDVQILPMEWGRFKEDVEKGRIQLWGLTWVGFKDPDIYRYAFSSDSVPPNGANRGWYSNPQLDKLLEQGKATTKLEDRIKIYNEIQKIVNADLPYVFLWHEENFAVFSNKLVGFQLYADGRLSALSSSYLKM
ncbi:MAG: ABC transporter substrate-binding protein [Oligoflexales bacterium]